MITTTALALSNAWGIRDFLSGKRIDAGVEVLPEVIDLVEKDVPQESEQTEMASFKVREGIFDGQNVYIVVEVKPTSPDYLLLGSDATPSDPVGNMGPLFQSEIGTIADYARLNNKTPIHTWLGVIKELPSYSLDFILEDDGTLVYMLSGRYDAADAGSLELHLTCGVAPFIGQSIDTQNEQRIELSCTLQNTVAKDSVANESSATYNDCGVRVEKITLTGSPMAIYAEIEFTVIDKEKFAETDGGLWFEFIDENGNRLPSGAATAGTIEAADDNGVCYIQKDSIQAAEILPGEIILRGYNSWEKNRYEAHTFVMQ